MKASALPAMKNQSVGLVNFLQFHLFPLGRVQIERRRMVVERVDRVAYDDALSVRDDEKEQTHTVEIVRTTAPLHVRKARVLFGPHQ